MLDEWLVYDWFTESTKPLHPKFTTIWLKAGINFPSCSSDIGSLFQKIHKAIFNKMCAFISLASETLE